MLRYCKALPISLLNETVALELRVAVLLTLRYVYALPVILYIQSVASGDNYRGNC